jgi:hypothetical protein
VLPKSLITQASAGGMHDKLCCSHVALDTLSGQDCTLTSNASITTTKYRVAYISLLALAVFSFPARLTWSDANIGFIHSLPVDVEKICLILCKTAIVPAQFCNKTEVELNKLASLPRFVNQ